MSPSQETPLHDRVDRLEKAVQELQSQVAELRPDGLPGTQTTPSPAKATAAPPPARKAIVPRPAASPSTPRTPSTPGSRSLSVGQGESWLKLTGIGLVVLGVAFLLKHSIDQGWLTEPVRIGLSLALGAVLFAVGLRVHSRRRPFGQVLLGGGIAVYYLTGFAAFQLYHLISHPVAFAYMVAVTLLAFLLALRQREPALSLIGAAGGLGTPFLLYTGAGDYRGLVAYTCLVLTGTAAIYLYRGWRSLLITSVAGGWLVLLAGHGGLPGDPQAARVASWALQVGVLFVFLPFWVVPVVREVLVAANPARWPIPPVPAAFADLAKLAGKPPHVLAVSTPLIALGLSSALWNLPEGTWGWIVLAGALLYGAVAWRLRTPVAALAYTHALTGLLLLTISFSLHLEGNALFLAIIGEATVLHFVARRLRDRGTGIGAHILFAMGAVALAIRMVPPEAAGSPVFDAPGLTNLAVIAAALVASFALRTEEERLAYRVVAHVAVLGWVFREMSGLEAGQAYTSIIWGTYAIGLLVAGLRRDLQDLSVAGLGTLALVVAKLLLVDLAELEALWRILVFLGFGGVFLIISYYFQSLWKTRPPTSG